MFIRRNIASICFVILLGVSNLTWGACPEGQKMNDRTSFCEAIPGWKASGPLESGFCYLETGYASSFQEFTQDECDAIGGVLFRTSECKKSFKAYGERKCEKISMSLRSKLSEEFSKKQQERKAVSVSKEKRLFCATVDEAIETSREACESLNGEVYESYASAAVRSKRLKEIAASAQAQQSSTVGQASAKSESGLEEALQKLAEDYKLLQVESDQLREEKISLLQGRTILEEIVARLKTDNKVLKETNEAGAKSGVNLGGVLQQLTGETKELQAKFDQLSEDNVSLRENTTILSQALEVSKQDNKLLKDELTKNSLKTSDSSQELDDLEAQLVLEQERYRLLKAEHEALQNEIVELVPDLADRRHQRQLAVIESVKATANAYRDYLTNFIQTKILTDTTTATALVPILKQYESALVDPSFDELDQLNTDVRNALNEYGLSDDLAKIESALEASDSNHQTASLAELSAIAHQYKSLVESFISQNILTNTDLATAFIPLVQQIEAGISEQNSAGLDVTIKSVEAAINKHGLLEVFADLLETVEKPTETTKSDTSQSTSAASADSSKSAATTGLKLGTSSSSSGLKLGSSSVLSLSTGASAASADSSKSTTTTGLKLGTSSSSSGLKLGSSSVLTLSGTKSNESQNQTTSPVVTGPTTKAGKQFQKFSRYWRKLQAEYFTVLRKLAEIDVPLNYESISQYKEMAPYVYLNLSNTGGYGVESLKQVIPHLEYDVSFMESSYAYFYGPKQFADGYGIFSLKGRVSDRHVQSRTYSPLAISGLYRHKQESMMRELRDANSDVGASIDGVMPKLTFYPSCLYQKPVDGKKRPGGGSICHTVSASIAGQHGISPATNPRHPVFGLDYKDVGRHYSKRQYPLKININNQAEFLDVYKIYIQDLGFLFEQATELFPLAEDVRGENDRNIALTFGNRECYQIFGIHYFTPEYIDQLKLLGGLSQAYVKLGELIIALIEEGGLGEYEFCEKLVDLYEPWKNATADAFQSSKKSLKTLSD